MFICKISITIVLIYQKVGSAGHVQQKLNLAPRAVLKNSTGTA